MEKYYDGDQDTFFREAHVINPFNKPTIVTKPKVSYRILNLILNTLFSVFNFL